MQMDTFKKIAINNLKTIIVTNVNGCGNSVRFITKTKIANTGINAVKCTCNSI